MECVDDVAGLPSRCVSKLFAPIPLKSVGRISLGLLLTTRARCKGKPPGHYVLLVRENNLTDITDHERFTIEEWTKLASSVSAETSLSVLRSLIVNVIQV
jgi:hypothetical protein